MKPLKLIYLALCLVSIHAWAQTPDESLKNKLNAMKTMSADFHQVVKAKKREVSRSSGSMALERPGKFRWKTIDPMEQLIIADGKKMWVYDVDLEQVTVKKQDQGLGGTAALFLSGYDDRAAKDFTVSEKIKGNKHVFDLLATSSKENFQRIKLTFTQDRLTELELYDQLGQVTFVKLGQIKTNPALAPKLFQFQPPKGVDVIKQ